MHVILTGKRQVGKSTMCRRITEAVKKEGHSVGGVWTETIMHAEERTLMVHNLDGGESTLLASTARQGPGPKQGNFVFSYEGIFAGIRAIGNAMKHDLLAVDEIGPLEMRRQGFFPVLHTISRARHSLLVIREELIDAALVQLRLGHDFEVIPVVPEYRDELLERLAPRFLDALQNENK
ncbi:MAG: nucleoside-triphosphatase [Candidatus Lernaella stagnicola]|nr:nucleoside-triphosphatase [Candidatus Lernaella stagnicola]